MAGDAKFFIYNLIYETETDMFMKIFKKDRNLFDFSNYPKDLQFYDPLNKKEIGKMKDEVKGNIINEIVGLKSKMYSLVTIDDKEIKKTKCVN